MTEEKTFSVPKDAEVLLADSRDRRFVARDGSFADLHPGALVTLTLAGDGKAVERLVAEGPSVQGAVKAVDADKGTLTLTLPRGRGEDPEDRTFAVGKKAEVVLDDGRGRRFSFKEGKLADLRAGGLATLVSLKLSLDQKAVQSITVARE